MMKVLLDTNIVIHREAGNIVNPDIDVLFKWLDDCNYSAKLTENIFSEI